MALILCPECNNRISDRAEICPYCGLPKKYLNIKLTNKTEVIQFSDYKSIRKMLITFSDSWRSLFGSDRYIPKSEAKAFYQAYDKYVDILSIPLVHEYIRNNAGLIGFDARQSQRFLNCMLRFIHEVEKHNNDFTDRKLTEYKEYFDNMLKAVDSSVILDEDQKKAVITDEDYCLLVAGAGAGKTTTMAAKVKYLVEKQGVAPSDIIVISYTNKAIDELKERINKKLGIPVKICTFHAFGYDILRKTSDEPPIVNNWAYKIIFECIEKHIFHDKRLLENVLLFLGFYFELPEEALAFTSLNEYCNYKAEQDYESLKSRVNEYNRKIIDIRTKRMSTITGEYLRSMQEVQIANFLFLNDIEYEYEKPYPYPLLNARKIYTPDFFIKQGDRECYIEHFGVSEQYQNSFYSAFELQRYRRQIIDKRRIHQAYNTSLIETYSRYSDGRSIFAHLTEELSKKGFILRRKSDEEVYKKLTHTAKDKYVYRLIMFLIEFIGKYKTDGQNEAGFAVLREKQDNARTNMFLDIAEEVYKYYQAKLKEKNQIDFADMINDAEQMLRDIADSGLKPSYKYIIIDEFQDIARQRFNLTKTLVDVTGAKVVAVGDDWQSVYAFAGSDITLFQKFLELMGDGKEMQIVHTYRNSQELIDIAGKFVQKNPTQIKKRLISPKSLPNPIEVIGFDDTKQYRRNWCLAVEKAIGKIVAEFGEKSSILLIGRYNFDMDQLIKYGPFTRINDEDIKSDSYPKARIKFLTAHSSKGLGFDNVILVNMIDSKFGFPSQLEDDPIIKLVTHEDHSMPYAEERRLFYVAMTRTKNRVYMITPNKQPSSFVLELIRDYNIAHDESLCMEERTDTTLRCPICGSKLKYENNKNYGLTLYMCTNDPEICDFMTNNRNVLADIFKCPDCEDGFMIVKSGRKSGEYFYGCTNYNRKPSCKHSEPLRFSKTSEQK